MGLELEVAEGVLRARLEGRFSGDDAPRFAEGVLGRLPRSKLVVVNMARVDYVSSSGLGALVKLYKDLRDLGGSMAIAGASERIRGLFGLAGMSELIDFAETERDAIVLLQE